MGKRWQFSVSWLISFEDKTWVGIVRLINDVLHHNERRTSTITTVGIIHAQQIL
jgi:hypothetical protein